MARGLPRNDKNVHKTHPLKHTQAYDLQPSRRCLNKDYVLIRIWQVGSEHLKQDIMCLGFKKCHKNSALVTVSWVKLIS